MSRYKFIAAAVVTVIYIALAAGFVREDRKTHTGGFINLQGMMSSIVTLPVRFPSNTGATNSISEVTFRWPLPSYSVERSFSGSRSLSLISGIFERPGIGSSLKSEN